MKRGFPVFLLGAGALLSAVVWKSAPREQELRIVLGSAAPRVSGLTVHYADPSAEPDDEVTFHFALGSAPRIVSHAPRLRDGTWQLTIELFSPTARAVTTREVTLRGDPTSVDVSEAVPQ